MSMRPSLFSVKSLLIGLFGLAAGILIAISGFLMISARQQQVQAERRMEIGSITRHLFQAMQFLRIERGTVTTALAGKEPVDSGTWRDIQALREKSGPAQAAALNELSRLDIDDRDRWVSELRAKAEAANSVRSKADAILQKQAGGGDQLSKQWVADMGALVDGLDALSNRLSAEVRLGDPFFDQMMTVKQLGWSVRADAGFERLLIGKAIGSGAKASEDRQRRIGGLPGRVRATSGKWGDLFGRVGARQGRGVPEDRP